MHALSTSRYCCYCCWSPVLVVHVVAVVVTAAAVVVADLAAVPVTCVLVRLTQ